MRLGFVYERVPHITLKAIANNAEIDVIHEKWQATLEPLRASLKKALKYSQEKSWEEWEIPREELSGQDLPERDDWEGAVDELDEQLKLLGDPDRSPLAEAFFRGVRSRR